MFDIYAREPEPAEHRILIVDDDLDNCEAIQAFLELHGFAAVAVSNGADALTKLRAGLRPWLILLDLTMPGKDGFQFRDEQRADPEIAHIPVVVYSGYPVTLEGRATLDTVAYLDKPVDPDQLLRVVETALLHRQVPSALQTEFAKISPAARSRF